MPIVFEEKTGTNVLHLRLIGKLARNDYALFVPEVERMIASHGKIRVLMEMRDFHGWDMAALWQDVKFDVKHFKDIERIAMVGDQTWQKWMAGFCKPFTAAEIRHFELTEMEEAEAWLVDAHSEGDTSESAAGPRSIKISAPN